MIRRTLTAVALAAVTTALAAPAEAAKKELKGTLVLSSGKANTGGGKAKYTGTYFRMIIPGGTDQFFANPDSRAKDKTYTLLRPGTDRGLKLGAWQAFPDPAFSESGDAKAKRIVRPTSFAGIDFSIGTNETDPQTNDRTTPPKLLADGRKVTGDLRAWNASWNSIYFNQGAPKPNGSVPGFTRPPTGRYDRKTGKVEVIWYSLIVGGPFNGFTGFWHLEGKLKP